MYRILLFSLFLAGKCFGQNTYYVDATGGNDANDGLTPQTAWKNIAQVNAFAFQPGDSILFKRNETWRDQLLPKSGNSSAVIYYGAFGTGNKPRLLGSHNKNALSDWVNVSGNIWKCTTTYPIDIGNIIFDQEASVGMKKWLVSDLLQQDDFYYDKNTDEVYLYSAQNPAQMHSVIELAIRRFIIDHSNCSYTTFENLDLRYGGAHGFGGSSTAFLTIRKCDITFIGGGDLNMNGTNVRYGNGIEFWGNAHDNLVEQCFLNEIYDTGVTNQNHTDIKSQYNITYRYNVISNCGMAALEVWNRPAASITHNIRFLNNTCVNSGYGWGSQRPDYSGAGIAFWHNESQLDSVIVRNNIFSNSQRTAYFIEDATGADGKIIDHNRIYNGSTEDTVYWNYGVNVFVGSQFSLYTTNTNFDAFSTYSDPLFVNAGNLDFTLLANSPCIDAALEIGATYDFYGNPVPNGTLPDIGAIEYGVLGLQENESMNWFIYPNPTNGILTIQNGAKTFVAMEIQIIDMTGRVVARFDQDTPVLDVSFLKNGMYYLVSDTNTAFNCMFMKTE